MSAHLLEIVRAQKRGEPRGIPSLCSAHAWVLRTALREAAERDEPVLVEATCNQVNQFGGYTGLTPGEFADSVRQLAAESGLRPERIILGGDHLGPNPWRDEPEDAAMGKASQLVRQYAEAGYHKLHLDASMALADDLARALPIETIARRTARLADAARVQGLPDPVYVIGSEVPAPGGAQGHDEGVPVTSVASVEETLKAIHAEFRRRGLGSAWERVIAVVVQPGVEFGDDFVVEYRPESARALSRFIEAQPNLVYEAHSTDFQSGDALAALVRDHFAILKVGPALTFAFREAVFALASIEDELFAREDRSDIVAVLDQAMRRRPEYWREYYSGTEAEQALKRRFSRSDRIRYYWTVPDVDIALHRLLGNLRRTAVPLSMLSEHMAWAAERVRTSELEPEPGVLIRARVSAVLQDYRVATRAK